MAERDRKPASEHMGLSNVQLYSRVLNTQQAYKEYQDGIESLPIPDGNITSWLPLKGMSDRYRRGEVKLAHCWLLLHARIPGIGKVGCADGTISALSLL